jgi:uncharacterized protein (TIGR02265 family)
MEAFLDPRWDAPLDVDAAIAAIPPDVTMKGMFFTPLVEAARTRHVDLGYPRDRYLPFGDYPMTEHVRGLAASARAFYPHFPVRNALRRLGQGVLQSFQGSTVGRVVWSGVYDIEVALRTLAKSYTLASPVARAEVVELGASRAVVHLEHVYWFLDSHHIGVFEGVLRSCGAEAVVRVRTMSLHTGDIECTW